MIERTERYLRLIVILCIAVVSISGMGLFTSPGPRNNHWTNLNKADLFGEFFESTLSSSFENSLVEVDLNGQTLPPNLTLQKVFRIDNRLIDMGRIYQGKIDDQFDRNLALRKMIDLLSDNYPHIRREAVHEDDYGNFATIEERGQVFNDFERFNYVSRIITKDNDAWILVLTYDDNSVEKVRDLLDLFQIENENGVIG